MFDSMTYSRAKTLRSSEPRYTRMGLIRMGVPVLGRWWTVPSLQKLTREQAGKLKHGLELFAGLIRTKLDTLKGADS